MNQNQQNPDSRIDEEDEEEKLSMVNIFYAEDFETKEDLFAHAKNEIIQADDKDVSYEGTESAWGTWVYDRLIEDEDIEQRGVKYGYSPSTWIFEVC